jgi:hypothetical protein
MEIVMHQLFLIAFTAVQSRAIVARTSAVASRSGALSPAARLSGDQGQTTAGVAMLLLGWATKSGAIGKLFDVVLNEIVGRVK